MKSQNQIVLSALRKGSLTSAEAWSRWGISRLSSCVFHLRKQGYPVRARELIVSTRYGKARVACYSL